MVSAWKDGKLEFVRVTSSGAEIPLHTVSTAEAAAAAGSSEGAIAASSEKWPMVPVKTSAGQEMFPNDSIRLYFTAAVGFTMDASDSACNIPIQLPGKTMQPLVGNLASSGIWDIKECIDHVLIADERVLLCERRIKKRCVFGGGKLFCSTENNA